MAKRFSKILPDRFQADNLGACIYATYLLTEYNVARGYVDFIIIIGELNFYDVSGRYHRDDHRWFKLSNGKIYDPTIGQLFKYLALETFVGDVSYSWKSYNEYTPNKYLECGCDITNEFKEYNFTPTKKGDFFRGAVWQYEVERPDLIPKKFRI